MQIGLDLQWVDIGCDGSTWNAQKQVSVDTDFLALIELLKHSNDLRATEIFLCYMHHGKHVDTGTNHEFGEEFQRFDDACRNSCAESYRSVCTGEFVLGPLE